MGHSGKAAICSEAYMTSKQYQQSTFLPAVYTLRRPTTYCEFPIALCAQKKRCFIPSMVQIGDRHGLG